MQIKNNKVILRDMQASDIDDIIRWNTIDTEWMLWDAPWEHVQEDDFDWKDYCQKKLIQIEAMKQSDDLRTRFEVCINDETQTHIGYISHYFVNEQYKIDEQGEKIAIGMDICSPCYRGNGYGSNAYLLYIDYLRKHGYQNIYTQTWSGNIFLIKMVEKLGFQECNRYVKIRQVNNRLYDGLTFVLR